MKPRAPRRPWCRRPSWSPDGEQVAFVSARDDNPAHIFVVPVEGGDPGRVTEGSEPALFPDWSPDGSQIVFNSPSGDVFVIGARADGGTPRRLVNGSGAESRWSRDGRGIYFKGAGERVGNIWEVQPDGTGARPLTDLSGRPGVLGYEPPATDGTHVYFIWVEDLGDIWVMDVVRD